MPVTGDPYGVEFFTDVEHGTKQGELFDEKIVRLMWNCPGAILICSQDCLNKDWCRKLEAPSLVRRWKAASSTAAVRDERFLLAFSRHAFRGG